MVRKIDAKNILLRRILDFQGCKAIELAAAVAQDIGEHSCTELLSELVATGEIVEVEFILPSQDFKKKSFLLPQGTEVRVHVVAQDPACFPIRARGR